MYIHQGKALFLAEDLKTVVEYGDTRARYLLVGDGGQLSDEDAAKYGLLAKAEPVKAKADAPPNKGLHITPPSKKG